MKFSTVILLGFILSHSAFSSSYVSDFEIKTSKDCKEVEFVEQKSLLVPIEELDPNNPPSGVITTSGEFFAIKPIGIYSGTVLPFPKPVPKPPFGTGGGGGPPSRSSTDLIDESGIYAGTVLPFPKPAPKPGGSGNGEGGPGRTSSIVIDKDGIYSGTVLPFPKPVPKPTGGGGGGGGGPASDFTGSFNDNGAFSDSEQSPLIKYNDVIYFCNLRK